MEILEREALDIREKGAPKNGERQALDRRLFLQLQAFGGVGAWEPLASALSQAGVEGALYEDVNDPRGVAVLALSEDPDFFVGGLRRVFNSAPFSGLLPKPALAMLGRTYALGYEPNLEDWLLHKPRRAALDLARPWAVWYPLRRTGAFALLSPQEQSLILKEHGMIGRSFGEAGLTSDVRLSCAGLDSNDNDFIIGLIGRDLYPISALVAAMRSSKQTASHIESMGPFFVGKAVWQSKLI